MHSSLNFFHVSLLYAVSWIFLLQWVSHSHFQLAELPYAHRKGFIIRNVLCKIDSRVACKGGGKKRNPCYQLPRLKRKDPVEGGGQRFRTIQMGQECWCVLFTFVVMDLFAAQTNASTPPPHPTPVSKEYWGLSSIHFLLPWTFILIREWSPPPGPTPNNWHCVLLGQEKYTLSTYPLGEVAVYEKIVAEHWTESVLLL